MNIFTLHTVMGIDLERVCRPFASSRFLLPARKRPRGATGHSGDSHITIGFGPLEVELAAVYAEIYRKLRQGGRIMSQVDMMLAAMARLKNLTLLTSDRDFEALPDIARENWLIS